MNIVFTLVFVLATNLCKSWILHNPLILNNYYFNTKGIGPLYAKKKVGRVLVTLECSISRKLGVPPSRYYTTKNKVNTPQRLELMKYNKYLRKHTLHKEIR
ncbi:Ribosomal protein L33 family protein [Theileria parva strain Muguga]|uniref:Ribosomal protein L33 family protein n=1 Tax=Theileria parva strain Muguga TaxID=333668 RepID=UPI001C62091F|nr:Ribosomal protein L33 family protein [Theileria parva strain Muguga]EAN33310.2 Ribosomal protein L33 family protein [Theileria parva strain Muguga]